MIRNKDPGISNGVLKAGGLELAERLHKPISLGIGKIT